MTTVMIELDDYEHRALLERARIRGMSLEGYIRHKAIPPRSAFVLKVIAGAESGKCDADIARDLEVTTRSVTEARVRNGVPANRRYPRRSQ